MKKRSRIIMWILIGFLSFITIVILFFQLPGSKTESEFNEMVKQKISKAHKQTDVFVIEDIKGLPFPVQRFFEHCGYLGTPKMSYMKAVFKDADFKLSDSKTIKIDYIQYNFIEEPMRFAYIDSSIFGIPFEGFDSYDKGVGSMRGTLAKIIHLFNQKGDGMNKACLVTVLAECFLIPSIILQDYITWESIDDTHAKATISYYGNSASGIFTFDEVGKVLSFKTSDRAAVDMDGSVRKADWSAVYEDYRKVNDIMSPTVLRSIWHFPEGDRVYFNENRVDVDIEYN